MGWLRDLLGKRGAKPQKLEDKLAALADCGITIRPPYTLQTLLDREDGERERLDKDNLIGFLYTLSLTDVIHGDGDEAYPSLSGQVLTFDTECVEDPGSYAPLIKELAAMTGGALRISNIVDEVECGQAGAELSFDCNGRRVCIAFDQEDDWFAPLVLECLAALLNASGSPLRFFWVDSGDQCAITGCLVSEQIGRLNALGVATAVYDQQLPLDGVTVA